MGNNLKQEKSMASAAADVFKTIKENEVKFVDLRFTDTQGQGATRQRSRQDVRRQQVQGWPRLRRLVDRGWKGIEASDMLLMPDPDSARMDPFFDEPTLVISCDVLEPSTGKGYERDPRTIAKKAEAYSRAPASGDTAYFGPEPEFFIFDAVEWKVDMSGSYVKIYSEGSARGRPTASSRAATSATVPR
jgi:glutamine synthetase